MRQNASTRDRNSKKTTAKKKKKKKKFPQYDR